MRQALRECVSKQFYHYDVDKWLEERGSDPFKTNRKVGPQWLASHVQWRCDFDADKWGIRGTPPGFGISRRGSDAR